MSCLNFQRVFVLAVMVLGIVLLLSGCSTAGALTGLVGSKPEITAQAGAENVKQTVGITAKQDASSKQETTLKESIVGKVDTSNKKKVSTSSIQAETITADKIEIRNSDDQSWQMAIAFFVAGFIGGVAVVTFYATRRRKKGG